MSVVNHSASPSIGRKAAIGLRKYAVLGYYGHANFGDDLLARAVIPLVLKRVPAEELLVSAPHGCYLEEWFPGVRCAPIGWSTRREYASVEKVVLGGGGLLFAFRSHNPFSLFGLARASMCGLHLQLLTMGWRERVRKYAFCIGLGPLDAPFARKLAGWYLKSFDRVVVRDTDSAAVAARCGVKDVVIATDAAVSAASGWIGARQGDRETVGIVLRNWHRTRGANDVVRALSDATKRLAQMGIRSQFFSFDPANDVIACQKVEEAGHRVIRWNPSGSGQDFVSAIGRCSVILTMRAHGLLLAWAMGIPVVPITVEPKLAAFANKYAPNSPRLSLTSSVDEIVDAALHGAAAPGLGSSAAEPKCEADLMGRHGALLLDWLGS